MVKGDVYECPICGLMLRHRDYIRRKWRTKEGKTDYVQIERRYCVNGHYHRVLPDWLLPYKQYEKELIFGVAEGLIDCETLGYEDYPCEQTMRRWVSR